MHKTATVVFYILLLSLASIVATPLKGEFTKNGLPEVIKSEQYVKNVHQVKSSSIQPHQLPSMRIRNFFADLIKATLRISPKDLLEKIDITFKDLDHVINSGMKELKRIEKLASPDVIKELKAIRDNVIKQIIDMIDTFTKDLGTVLPVLSPGFSSHDPTSDIIYALLGKTLEELITAVANSLECSLQLLSSTIADFTNLAMKAKPVVASALNNISDQHLNQARFIITPRLDQLKQLVDTTHCTTSRIGQD